MEELKEKNIHTFKFNIYRYCEMILFENLHKKLFKFFHCRRIKKQKSICMIIWDIV